MRSIVAAACVLLLSAPVVASDETDLFRQSALDILVKKGLEKFDRGKFVCLNIENKPASAAELTRFRQWGEREFGSVKDCKCVTAEPNDKCMRVGTTQSACTISVYDFKFSSFNNATATMTASCGWPSGGGEVARFERMADGWHYVEAVARIVF